jgi:hypothetical protein
VTAAAFAGGALAAAADSPARTALAAVLGDSCAVTGQAAVRLAGLLDPGFLAEVGWDPVTWVLAPPAAHRLIRWDCGRLDAWSGPSGREAPLPVPGGCKCAVLACLRARRAGHRQEAYCAVHAGRWQAARCADPALDERRWNQTAEPLPVTGQVNLRGLAPLVVVEMLYGLQQRAGAECTSYCRFLRRLARELRQAQVSSLSELPVQNEPARRWYQGNMGVHFGGGSAPYPHIALWATARILISSRRTGRGRMPPDVQKRCLPSGHLLVGSRLGAEPGLTPADPARTLMKTDLNPHDVLDGHGPACCSGSPACALDPSVGFREGPKSFRHAK